MQKFDKGCGFAIVTNDTFKVKIEKQLGKAAKTKINPKNRSRTRFKETFANIGKEKNLQTRLILNYIHPIPVYMAQSKHINGTKTLPCESLYP